MSREPQPQESGELNFPNLPTSEATDHARRTIGESRDLAKRLLAQFNARGGNGSKIVVRRDTRSKSLHTAVQSAVFSYRSLVSQPYRKGDAGALWAEQLDEIPVPKALIDSGGRYVDNHLTIHTTDANNYYKVNEPKRYDLELGDIDISYIAIGLDNMDWWHQRDLKVRIMGDDTYGNPKVDNRAYKLVIPIPTLQKAFEQINSIFAMLGEGIQPEESEIGVEDKDAF